MIRTSFRLLPATLHRLDALARALRKRQVGNVTRADIVRMLIESGLDRMEQQVKSRSPRARPRK